MTFEFALFRKNRYYFPPFSKGVVSKITSGLLTLVENCLFDRLTLFPYLPRLSLLARVKQTWLIHLRNLILLWFEQDHFLPLVQNNSNTSPYNATFIMGIHWRRKNQPGSLTCLKLKALNKIRIFARFTYTSLQDSTGMLL